MIIDISYKLLKGKIYLFSNHYSLHNMRRISKLIYAVDFKNLTLYRLLQWTFWIM